MLTTVVRLRPTFRSSHLILSWDLAHIPQNRSRVPLTAAYTYTCIQDSRVSKRQGDVVETHQVGTEHCFACSWIVAPRYPSLRDVYLERFCWEKGKIRSNIQSGKILLPQHQQLLPTAKSAETLSLTRTRIFQAVDHTLNIAFNIDKRHV